MDNSFNQMIDEKPLEMWVIYCSPFDYPGQYVTRIFLNGKRTNVVKTADSLDEIRRLVPAGLFCMPRDKSDPLSILETWF